MKKIITLAAIVLLSAACSPSNSQLNNNCSGIYNTKISVGLNILCIQIVSSTTDMQKGLSDRSSMQNNQGMLFVYTGQPAFWMKDMKFALDLIWIKDSKIISITKNVPYPRNAEENRDDILPTYSPPSSIDRVLEVNAGWAEKNNLKVGDSIKF